jgi:hypothetical protein
MVGTGLALMIAGIKRVLQVFGEFKSGDGAITSFLNLNHYSKKKADLI